MLSKMVITQNTQG